METITLTLGDSFDEHHCELDQLDDHEPATAATFSVSYYDDDNSRVTINDLIVTHRIYSDSNAVQHLESKPGNNATSDSDASSTPLQYTGLMLAESKTGPKEERYIMMDSEEEDGGGRSSGKTLHGHQITFAMGRWNNTNGPQSSSKNVLHATPIRITELLITLPDEEALEAVFRCEMAFRGLDDDAFDAACVNPRFQTLTQRGVPKLQAQYFCQFGDPDAVSSHAFAGVDIHIILEYQNKGIRARLTCGADLLHYHKRIAAEGIETFKADTAFKIKGHPDVYSLEPLPRYGVFSPRRPMSKVCLVDSALKLDDTTRIVSERDPERKEGSDWHFRKVEWGADSVKGLRNEHEGLIEFQHEGSGKKFQGIPRGQLVREGCPTGFVIISSTVEEGQEDKEPRTLAVRDHYLLWHTQKDDVSGEPGDEFETPVILPLVEDDFDAIFELKSSEEGDDEIEARLMEYGDGDKKTDVLPKATVPA